MKYYPQIRSVVCSHSIPCQSAHFPHLDNIVYSSKNKQDVQRFLESDGIRSESLRF